MPIVAVEVDGPLSLLTDLEKDTEVLVVESVHAAGNSVPILPAR